MRSRALAGEAVLVVVTSLAALLTVGALLQAELGLLGVLIAELALVLLPAWLWAAHRGLDLGIARPRAASVLGGALAGAGAFWLMALVEQHLLERVLPTPPEVRASLERLVGAGGARVLLADLLALSIAPALAEETLFRGAVLQAMRTPRRTWPAVVIAALGFGAFHASPWRILPAALLGLPLGALRVTSGSLWPAIAFHATNNLAVVAMVRAGRETVADPRSAVGAVAAAAAGLALLGGFRLARRPDLPHSPSGEACRGKRPPT
jgi:membrane protease YdiL (CAAX protease family)